MQFANLEDLYKKDPRIKREDIEIIREWIKKQPHLPKIKELQIMFFYHCCYYKIEYAKSVLDTFFTLRTHCPLLMESIQDKDVIRATMSTSFVMVLPKPTPKKYNVIILKLLDTNPVDFNWVNQIKLVNMIGTLTILKMGFSDGLIVLFDMKGFSLSLLTRLNLAIMKDALTIVQEGAPVRVTSVHFINPVAFVDKIMVIAKMCLKKNILNLIQFHSSLETLYEYVPLDCLPAEYGGGLPSSQELQEKNLDFVIQNLDMLAWHDTLTVDESKRLEQSKKLDTVFGVTGTFKKLEID